jgi:hypothetical protein
MGAFLRQEPGQVKFIESAIFRNIQYLGPRKGLKELRKKGVRKEENVRPIRDVYPGTRILTCVHPGSRIRHQQKRRGEKFFVLLFL